MGYLTWDVNIPDGELRVILKDQNNKHFVWAASRVLSRARFWDVFRKYLSSEMFLRIWPEMKDRLRVDPIGAGRIDFWDWVYTRLMNNGEGKRPPR